MVDRDEITEFAVSMLAASSRLARICQRGQTERRGRKESRWRETGGAVYLDGIERIDANSDSEKR